ncbi:hypothetical protein VTK26DRAFT_7023 [Humicola hyalothermophila]
MCHIDQFCYKCGHEVESKVQKCSVYRQKKAAAKGSIFRFLFRNRRSCGKVNYYRVSRAVACSQECAKRLRARAKREQRQRDEKEEVLVQRARDKAAAQRKYMENKRKKDEVELAQRERAWVKRAEAARREYLENKRKEEEALRRRQEERRRAEMLLARQQTRGQHLRVLRPGWLSGPFTRKRTAVPVPVPLTPNLPNLLGAKLTPARKAVPHRTGKPNSERRGGWL